jgi:hypothetical protein
MHSAALIRQMKMAETLGFNLTAFATQPCASILDGSPPFILEQLQGQV